MVGTPWVAQRVWAMPTMTADRGGLERVLETPYFADGAQPGEPAVLEHREAGGIVAAIFQPAQAFHQDGNGVAFSDHTHDSAHTRCSAGALKRLPSVPEPDRKSSMPAEGAVRTVESINTIC